MKNTKRAERRHHRRRMIQRALKLRRVRYLDERIQMQVALRLANTPKKCSCEYSCANPRHNGWSSGRNRLTMQERLSALDLVEYIDEVFD